MNPRDEIRKCREELRTVRARMDEVRGEEERLKGRLEADGYSREDFEKDDWVSLSKASGELRELEAREAQLVSDIKAWRNTAAGP